MKPVVSVLVAAHDAERYIGRCLRSLTSQVFDHSYEIVVVNDGSRDRTEYALSQFGNAIRIVQNKTNIGLPAALNRGIKAAKGSFIVRVDADDYVNQYFLTFLYEFLTRNDTFDAVACDYYKVDENEEVIGRSDAFSEPIGCAILFRKSHVEKLGGYNEEFLRHEDKEFMMRFSENYRLGQLKIPLYRYRMHGNNMTLDTRLMEYYKQRLGVEPN